MNKSTSKEARKPGIAHPSWNTMVSFCVVAAVCMREAGHAIDNAAALGKVARDSMRYELTRAYKVIRTEGEYSNAASKAKAWDKFKAQIVDGMLAKKLFDARKSAQLWLGDQVKACGLTGKGNRKGGKRPGAGRKEVTTFTHKVGRANVPAALAMLAEGQVRFADHPAVVAYLGEIAVALGDGSDDDASDDNDE